MLITQNNKLCQPQPQVVEHFVALLPRGGLRTCTLPTARCALELHHVMELQTAVTNVPRPVLPAAAPPSEPTTHLIVLQQIPHTNSHPAAVVPQHRLQAAQQTTNVALRGNKEKGTGGK